MGLAHITVGRRKTGKTTLSKKMLKNCSLPIVVYDINKEYSDFYNKPFQDFEPFLTEIVNLKGHYILIEEATIFFNTVSNFQEMKNLLVRARHTRNIIQLNFHSFKSVPKGIYNLLDYITIFKTNDTFKDVKERFDNPKVLKAFEQVNKSDNPYKFLTVNLY